MAEISFKIFLVASNAHSKHILNFHDFRLKKWYLMLFKRFEWHSHALYNNYCHFFTEKLNLIAPRLKLDSPEAVLRSFYIGPKFCQPFLYSFIHILLVFRWMMSVIKWLLICHASTRHNNNYGRFFGVYIF